MSRIGWIVVAAALLVVAADFLYEKHGHFSFENWFGFYGLFGFLGCVVLVLGARVMRAVLTRKEDYYGDE